jgi:hypothetical protein
MSLVQLHLDHARILKPAPDHILVETIPAYVPAYACMVEALHAGRPLTIVVRHPTCATWLQTAQEKYGSERVKVVTISHRGQLADLWGVGIPDWVTDEAIARSGLLEVPLRAQPGQSFEDVVLEAFYSPFLAYATIFAWPTWPTCSTVTTQSAGPEQASDRWLRSAGRAERTRVGPQCGDGGERVRDALKPPPIWGEGDVFLSATIQHKGGHP